MPESIEMKQPGFIVVKIETDNPRIAQGGGWQWNTVVGGAGSWTMQVSKYFDDIPTNGWASEVAKKAFGKAIKNIEVKRNGTANN